MKIVSDSRPSLKERFRSLPLRLALVAALFFLEKLLLNAFVGPNAFERLATVVHAAQSLGFRFLVAFAIGLALFIYVRAGSRWTDALGPPMDSAINVPWLLLHFLLTAPLMPLSHLVYRQHETAATLGAVVAAWLMFATAAVLAALRAMADWPTWRRAVRGLGRLWVHALLAALAATLLMQWLQSLWKLTAGLTFRVAFWMLRPVLPALSADPATLTLSTGRFAVRVEEGCSGLEGLGLMLAFSCAWLLYFRREYRFPRALLLVPVGLAFVYVLNAVRIAALVLIGNAGYPDVAGYGFHSQAGWIGFNLAAVVVVLLSRRVAWWRVGPVASAGPIDNPTAAYLAPLLAVLVAGTLAHAMSAGFETLYGLRLIAAVCALVWSRRKLVGLDWGFSWRGIAGGCAIFALWFLAARFLLPKAGEPPQLAALAPFWRHAWLWSRVLAAVLTVPVAEELAYRGFLMRRWVSAEFEQVSFRSVRWPALALTAAIFGIAHGAMWAPGIAAGWFYGAMVCRTGRLGESIAAHATTNLLLAAAVVLTGHWELW